MHTPNMYISRLALLRGWYNLKSKVSMPYLCAKTIYIAEFCDIKFL